MTKQLVRPVSGKRVWKRAEVEQSKVWQLQVPRHVCDELARTVTDAWRRGLTSASNELASYSIESLHLLLEPARNELADGVGFFLLRGLPIGVLSPDEMKMMLLIIGHHLGLVTPQTGDRPEIGEVMDAGAAGKKLFYYNRGGALPMHMDPVDVVGLLCVRKAKLGGESSICSSMAVHNAILRSRPELLDILYRGYRHHRRHHAADRDRKLLTDYYCPVFCRLEHETVCSFIPHVIEGAVEEGLLEFTPLEAEALEFFKATAHRPDIRLHMDLEPGDLQLLNNRAILHSRLDFEDYAEPERRRLMLRLWLTMPQWQKLPPTIPHKDVELQSSPA